MADRYQDRPFPADDGYDRGGEPHAPARAESDPLAELARLIGQTDPFAMGRANQPVQPRSEREHRISRRHLPTTSLPPARRHGCAARPRRRHRSPRRKITNRITRAPCTRCTATRRRLRRRSRNYHQAPSFAEAGQEPDPSRYDDALYGQLDPRRAASRARSGLCGRPLRLSGRLRRRSRRAGQEKRGGMMTVAVVLALAVVGTGAAFAYRTFAGSPRSGEPPIIKADNSPTKIVPAPADGSAKVPDRMAAGDGKEKIVPREEAPVDVNAQDRSARGVSAAESEQQSAVGRERCPAGPAPAGAGNGTLPATAPSRAGSRPLPSAAIRLTAPRCRSTRRRRRNPPPLQKRGSAASGRACHARPAILGQCERQRAAVADTAGRSAGSGRRAARPGSRPSIPHHQRQRKQRRRISGPGRLAEERGRRAGLLPGPAGQVFGRARIAFAGDQARRSRRQGRLLPRHDRPVRIGG